MQSAYYFVTLFLIFFFSSDEITQKKEYLLCSFLMLLNMLSLFWGLRNVEIGGDSVVYIRIFQHPETYTAKLEPAFTSLLSLLKIVSNNGNFLLFSLSFIILFFQLIVYYKIDSKSFFIYFIIYTSFYYYYQFHMNIMRQAIAILMVAMAFISYREKRFFYYCIWGFIGVMFHVTALIFLLYPIFYITIKDRKKQFLIVSIIMILFFTKFLSTIVSKIPDFHWAITKIKWYYEVSEPVHIKQSHLVSLFIIFVFSLNFEKMKKSTLFNLYTFHTVFFAFLGIFHECLLVYDRFYFYLQIFEPILLYEFRILFKEKSIYKYLCLIICAFLSLITVFYWGPRNFLTAYSFQFLK